jgi:hypothetical protein
VTTSSGIATRLNNDSKSDRSDRRSLAIKFVVFVDVYIRLRRIILVLSDRPKQSVKCYYDT